MGVGDCAIPAAAAMYVGESRLLFLGESGVYCAPEDTSVCFIVLMLLLVIYTLPLSCTDVELMLVKLEEGTTFDPLLYCFKGLLLNELMDVVEGILPLSSLRFTIRLSPSN